ncbi:hydroxyethylthiazole kinase [Nocardioides korecus]
MTNVETVVEVLQRLRERAPLVHCMTNVVVTNVTANGLLAVGASPAMVENAEESADFARIADGLLVNLGTLSRERAEAMPLAAAAARESGTPWVLDPVAVGALAFRTTLAAALLEHRPAVVRGNASEVLALAGAAGSGRGVDSTVSAEAAVDAARGLARRTGGAVAVSGEVDFLTDGDVVVEVHNGSPLLTRVTGAGCLLGALVAACAGVGAAPLEAAVAATGILTVAADVAAESASAPGSFAVGLIDALYTLEGPVLVERMVLR